MWIAVLLIACGKKETTEAAGSNVAPLCVSGEQAECAAAGYKYTGSHTCCLPVTATTDITKIHCVSGEQAACAQAGGKWTGQLCCLEGTMTCTTGEMAACAQSGSLWTGAKCCAKN
jgi:hypothetical protein